MITRTMKRGGVFLDRDGTINREVDYLRRVEDFALIDGAAAGIRALNERGLKVAVLTNQAGIARGYLTESMLHEIHDKLRSELHTERARLDGIYFCPHHPTAGSPPYRRECECRKPATGMLRLAADELDVDLARSFVVGDKRSDLTAGQRAGCRTVLVRTGYGRETEQLLAGESGQPNYIADNILDAVEWILAQND